MRGNVEKLVLLLMSLAGLVALVVAFVVDASVFVLAPVVGYALSALTTTIWSIKTRDQIRAMQEDRHATVHALLEETRRLRLETERVEKDLVTALHAAGLDEERPGADESSGDEPNPAAGTA